LSEKKPDPQPPVQTIANVEIAEASKSEFPPLTIKQSMEPQQVEVTLSEMQER